MNNEGDPMVARMKPTIAGPLGTTAAGTTVADGAALDLNGYSLSSAATGGPFLGRIGFERRHDFNQQLGIHTVRSIHKVLKSVCLRISHEVNQSQRKERRNS
jgi:hypothetical protein